MGTRLAGNTRIPRARRQTRRRRQNGNSYRCQAHNGWSDRRMYRSTPLRRILRYSTGLADCRRCRGRGTRSAFACRTRCSRIGRERRAGSLCRFRDRSAGRSASTVRRPPRRQVRPRRGRRGRGARPAPAAGTPYGPGVEPGCRTEYPPPKSFPCWAPVSSDRPGERTVAATSAPPQGAFGNRLLAAGCWLLAHSNRKGWLSRA